MEDPEPTLTDAAPDAEATKDDSKKASTKKPRNRKKIGIVVGVVAAVIIVVGAGFMYAHEQPWFCNFFCHAPMDPALATYEGTTGSAGVDKFGNTVEDAGDMLVVVHKEQADAKCTTCHESVIAQQITEGLHWVPGDYLYPLEERSLTALNGYGQNETPEQFCLNENCHDTTRQALSIETANLSRNPHVVEVNHPVFECSNCHKVHRQSVMYCSACHEDADIPEGWLSFDEAAAMTGEESPEQTA